MFIVFLTFTENREKAGQFMDGHKAWLKRGFEDGVFLLAGSLLPGAGGTVLAHGVSPEDLKRRVDEDPFVTENIVTADIREIAPAKADERLAFLVQ